MVCESALSRVGGRRSLPLVTGPCWSLRKGSDERGQGFLDQPLSLTVPRTPGEPALISASLYQLSYQPLSPGAHEIAITVRASAHRASRKQLWGWRVTLTGVCVICPPGLWMECIQSGGTAGLRVSLLPLSSLILPGSLETLSSAVHSKPSPGAACLPGIAHPNLQSSCQPDLHS